MKKAVFIGLFLSALIAGVFAQKNDGIFSYKVGDFEVYMLVEARRTGNAGILVGADEALIKRSIPLFGFFHSTNVFLIKAPGRNILVDTGFGRAVFDHMKKLNIEPEKIDVVLLTHMHGDHIGGLAKDGKALFPNAKIYLASRELNYWTRTNVNQGAVAALAPYSGRTETFDPALLNGNLAELIPGITPIASYGHTPGHTAFLLESGGEKLIIAGDFLHVALVQFPNPDISATYDIDGKAAAAARKQIMAYAEENRIPVGGMHVVYPGVGMVEADGEGFRFIPQ